MRRRGPDGRRCMPLCRHTRRLYLVQGVSREPEMAYLPWVASGLAQIEERTSSPAHLLSKSLCRFDAPCLLGLHNNSVADFVGVNVPLVRGTARAVLTASAGGRSHDFCVNSSPPP